MITIDKMITHILDPSSNIIVCSDTCMEVSEECISMMEAKITKAFTSSQRKVGVFKEGSPIQAMVESYRASIDTFEEMSKKIAKFIFEGKCKCGLFSPSDLILAEVVYEDRRYLVGLDNAYLEGLSHSTNTIGESVENELLINSTLLSSSLIKRDCAFTIEYGDFSVASVEAKVEIEAQKRYFYSDVVLSCDSTPSYSDAVKTITKACQDVVKEYELDSVEVMPKMKQIIKENVEAQEDIKVEEVAEILFSKQPLARQHFEQEVKEQGVAKPIPVENMKSTKSEKVQKIKTDKGIEIIIPVDYMNSTDYVEFNNKEDGTISIQLKNINRIISK